MGDLLPILTGLVVITALAVVSSSDDKGNKKEEKKEEKKENKIYGNKKEHNIYGNKKDDIKLNELINYFKKNLTSSKRKQKRYRLLRDSRGRTVKNSKGQKQYVLSSKSI